MESGRRKRKLQDDEKEAQKEDEEEEEKMKLFFALIQNTKSIRDRVKSKQSAPQQDKSKGVWNPKFQPEDFIEDCDKKSNPTPQFAASSSTKQRNKQEEEEQGKDKVEGIEDLDLNLSL